MIKINDLNDFMSFGIVQKGTKNHFNIQSD